MASKGPFQPKAFYDSMIPLTTVTWVLSRRLGARVLSRNKFPKLRSPRKALLGILGWWQFQTCAKDLRIREAPRPLLTLGWG